MNRRNFLYSRWPFELPSLLLVALWIGLWFAWPRMDAPAEHTRPSTSTRIRFVDMADAAPRRDDLLGFLFQSRDWESIADDPVPIAPVPTLASHPHLLGYREHAGASDVVDGHATALAQQAAAEMRGYRPAWPALNPYGDGPAYALATDIQLCRELAAAGFMLPAQSLNELNDGDKAWEFTYYVVCDQEGRARDVFALGDPVVTGLQSNVTRVLYQARVRPGAACEGRVTVRRVYAPVSAGSPASTGKEQIWPAES
ncbi:MAG: hypothetical protein K8T26_15245 [Lentisphaerae bacterium]|nr:hypothetical protein [Lentisphaerota bacterium]